MLFRSGQGRPRQGDNREPGGFRIRLSDNEMQAARALQEAFGLRSTVAVLGFSLRTLAQQLEAGQLDELVAQQRAQARDRGPAASGRGGGERRGPRDDARGGGGGRAVARANPFARPSRPQASVAAAAEPSDDLVSGGGDSSPIDALPGDGTPVVASDHPLSEEAGLPAAESAPVAEGSGSSETDA